MLDPSLIPLVQRLDRDPEDREAVETLCRELDGRGEHEVLAMLLEKVAGRRRTPESSVELLHRAALTWSSKVGDDPKALKLWNQVLEAQPHHDGALLGTATVFRRTHRGEQAEAVYKRLLDKAISPAKKVPVLEAMAGLCAEREMPDKEIEVRRELATHQGSGAAATSNRRSLARLLVERSRKRRATTPLAEGEVDPDQREAAALLGLVAKEGATGRAVEFAQAALSLWPGEVSAFEVLEESGSLKQADLTTLRIQFLAADPKGARGQRVRRDLADAYVATHRPEDAVTVLSAAADDDPQAAQSLAKLYEKLGRHLDLAKLLDRLPMPAEDDARLAVLRRRAQAWKQSGQKPQHLAALRSLLDESPAEAEALAEIERDCRLQGLLGELRDRLRAAAKVDGVEAASRVRWLREVAQLAERRFDDVADARTAWESLERVAETAEGRAEAQAALLRLMTRVEDWDQVLERLATQAEAEDDPSESRRLWMRWVQVRREHRPDVARETEVLERLWVQHPDDDVGRALTEARRRAGDDIGVTAMLYALIERAGPTHAASRWSQLAEHLERIGDLESSVEAWRNARSIDPTSALAWEAEARVLGAMGDREAQLTTLVAYADHPVAPGRRAGEFYGRAAQLSFELGRKEQARQLAERALRFSPDDDAMKGLVATLDDPGTAPVMFEELLAEVARRAEAKAEAPASEPVTAVLPPVAEPAPETPAAEPMDRDEPTGIVTVETDVIDEPTKAIAIERDADEEQTRAVTIERQVVDEPAAAVITEPPTADPAPAETEAVAVAETDTGAAETEAEVDASPTTPPPEPTTLAASAQHTAEVIDELSDDAIEELSAEPESTASISTFAQPEPEPEPTASISTFAEPEPAPKQPTPPAESEERTPLDGVALPEVGSVTAELKAPPPPIVVAPPPTDPPSADEDSMIIDESLFGEPTSSTPTQTEPPAPTPTLKPAASVAAPVAAPPTNPPPAPTPSVPPPARPRPSLPSLPTLPRQRIATGVPPSMPAPAPPAAVTPSFTPITPEPPPEYVAPPPAVSALQFNPQPVAVAPPPPALQFNPQPVAVAPPPPALQFNPQPIAIAPPPPALQFNPQPVAVAPPPPALQFNPQPIAVAPPPPALQFNPQPVAIAPSPGDPFTRVSGDWVVDASGDPFAQSSAPAAAPQPPPEVYTAPPPPPVEVYAPPPPPQPTPQGPAFERVLLPMLEKLLHG